MEGTEGTENQAIPASGGDDADGTAAKGGVLAFGLKLVVTNLLYRPTAMDSWGAALSPSRLAPLVCS